MAALTPTAKMQFLDASGAPLVGGKLYTYTAGTTTPQATYTDSSGGSANTNPIILDSRGEANVWLGGANYKFKLTDSTGVEIWTVDNISAPTSGVSPALSGNVTIDTNSSSPALKITQTGTGLALRVQDSADPDSTPTVIDGTGKLGVGTASPSELVDISGGNLAFTSSGGASYAKITPGASLTDIASIGATALTLTTNGSERMRVTDTGLVGIGKTPSAGVALDVNGSVTASTSIITDTITERTASAGVTVGGVLLKSSLISGVYRPITAATAVASTSGTSVDFTSIPSWVKRITVILQGVSTSGSAGLIIYLGTGATPTYVSAGYAGAASTGSGAIFTSNVTTGVYVATTTAASIVHGVATIYNLSGNSWVGSCNSQLSNTTGYAFSTASISLGAALTAIRLYAGGDTFDAGSVNIHYE